MDKSWIEKPRTHSSYLKGVEYFIKFATENALVDEKIVCPCQKCYNKFSHLPSVVEDHLAWNGFLYGYTTWVFHGESFTPNPINTSHLQSTSSAIGTSYVQGDIFGASDMREMIRDTIRCTQNESLHDDVIVNHLFEGNENDNETVNKTEELMQEYDIPLYPGCQKFSSLAFTLRLYHLKVLNGWSGKSFSMLLNLLNEAFPDGASLPSSYYDAKKLLRELNLGYEKIHACPKDYMLFWGGRNGDSCHVCGTSRWASNIDKDNNDDSIDGVTIMPKKRKPAKVLRYFPLIPRLKRLYSSSKIASSMRWHEERRTKDGILRHPADAAAWKAFDERYPSFSSDSRSVRLGLASDGFNPFRTMSTTYSTWPVVLITYNMEPWVCMKKSSLILSMVIPGEKGPGNDIDVYLQHLVEELKLLWEGVDAYDSATSENFKLKATLMWTVNDFSAYTNLSGWSTKGRTACPSCEKSTHCQWLNHGGTFSYMGHRRWLEPNHPFRFQKVQFDGTEEFRLPPVPPSGVDVLKQVELLNHVYGKLSSSSKKRAREDGSTSRVQVEGFFENVDDFVELAVGVDDVQNAHENENVDASIAGCIQSCWKKRSIFFDLPYWQYNLLRHNLDVMHIEKNVCDNLIGTLLNLEGKSKDNLKARLDLQEMGIRHELHPKVLPNGKTHLPLATYNMSLKEKDLFFTVLQNLKVSDGYASNISRCVNPKERKLSNLKSHDGHVLMQDILLLALRGIMSNIVVISISRLSSFFKRICSKTLDPNELDELQSQATLALCHIEKIFPPGFFTVMVHLVIHLTHEVKLGGPVQYRRMYPIERFLVRLKSYVRNKAQPEGSIAEGYIAEECLTFFSRYLAHGETAFNRTLRNYEVADGDNYLFSCGGRYIGKEKVTILDEISLSQAHHYVLLHSDKMEPYHRELLASQRRANRNLRPNQNILNKWLVEKFAEWLLLKVPTMESSDCPEVVALARGPNNIARSFEGFIINGFRFHTKDREKSRKTQNSGVTVEVDGQKYYGVVTEISKLDYYGKYKVVLFRCDWIDVKSPRGFKQDANGFTLVNFSALIHTEKNLGDDPFVFSSQVKQVFYIDDPIRKGWLLVVTTKPRDLYDMGSKSQEEDNEAYTECEAQNFSINNALDNFTSWNRLDNEEDANI